MQNLKDKIIDAIYKESSIQQQKNSRQYKKEEIIKTAIEATEEIYNLNLSEKYKIAQSISNTYLGKIHCNKCKYLKVIKHLDNFNKDICKISKTNYNQSCEYFEKGSIWLIIKNFFNGAWLPITIFLLLIFIILILYILN